MPITDKDASHAKRIRLAEIAEREGELRLAGDGNLSGARIEKYLSLFREAMNAHGRTDVWSDPSKGFQWCGAFVYHCCVQAGFRFSPKPNPDLRCTLAAVRAWHDWAMLPENRFFTPASGQAEPAIGDIVIFNRLLEDVDFDHIGVVIGVHGGEVRTAEGNVRNVSGIFLRDTGPKINGYVRISGY